MALFALLALPDRPHAQPLSGPDGGGGPGADGGVAVGPAGAGELSAPTLESDSPARYPTALEAKGVGGEVLLELVVDETGRVTNAEVTRGAHPELDAAAREAALGLRFSPARLGTQAVAIRMPFSYRFVPQALEQRPVQLTGVVRSKGTRRPIAGALVEPVGLGQAAPDQAAADTRTETDAQGGFSLTVPARRVWLRVSAPGFRSAAFPEELAGVAQLEVSYSLEPTRLERYETVVRSERARSELSRTTLHDEEVREVPGTLGDPFRVVMLLPGVSSILSGASYPVVRGTSPASTGYYLDGVRVPLLYHLVLGPAVIHPDFIQSIDFYPGGAPVRYGRLLGGVVDGRLSRPTGTTLHGSLYADLINAGGFLEAPVEATGSNLSLAGRVSYTPWLIGLFGAYLKSQGGRGAAIPDVVLDFYDYQARVEQRLGGSRVRLFAFGSSDTAGTTSDDASVPVGLQSVSFDRIDLRASRAWNGGEVQGGATFGLDRFEIEQHSLERGDFSLEMLQRSYALRTEARATVAPEVELSFGADADHRRSELTIDRSFQPEEGPVYVSNTHEPLSLGTFWGAFAELVSRAEKPWTLVLGLRADAFHMVPRTTHFSADPRLTLRYQASDRTALKAGVGLFHQQPTFLINLPVVDISALRYGLQESAQAQAGVELKLPGNLELFADAYASALSRTVELTSIDDDALFAPDPTTPTPQPVDLLPGSSRDGASHGYAYGFELLVRHPLGQDWFGWLSYSYQRSVRWGTFTRYGAYGERLSTDEGYLPYTFDQTHVLNLVLSRRLPRNWKVGAALHFHTGRPETGGLTSRTRREGTTRKGVPAWIRVDKDRADRLPPYARLDLRVSKSWAFDAFACEVYLDFMNATVSQEIIAFDYLDAEDLGRPTDGSTGEPLLEKRPQALPLAMPLLGVKASF